MKEYFEINNQFRKYLPIFLIMISIIVLMGTSYALLRSSQVGSNTYVMNVGLLEVTFVDSKTDAFTVENMVPITDEEGINLENELVFAIKNTGTMTSSYDLYIEETSTNPEFKEVIRYISNKNDKGYNEPKTLSDDKYIEKGNILKVGEEANYKVKVWLDENANSTYMNKEFKARIVVDSVQLAATPTSCFEYVERTFYTYNTNITDEEVAVCVNFLIEEWGEEEVGNHINEGESYEAFCKGTGTNWGETFQSVIDNGWWEDYQLEYFLENNILTSENGIVIYGYDNSCGEDVVFPKIINEKKVLEIRNNCYNDLYPMVNESIRDTKFNNLVFDNKNNNSVNKIDSCENSLLGMKRIVIPNTVKILGEHSFSELGLTSVIFEENSNLRLIKNWAFYENNLTTIEIPSSVQYIYEGAFNGNNLKTIKLNFGLQVISNASFRENNITEVTIPDSVNFLSCYSFDDNVIINKNDSLECIDTSEH